MRALEDAKPVEGSRHREVVDDVDPPESKHRHNVRVMQSACSVSFAFEAFALLAVFEHIARQHFQRDAAVCDSW